MGTKRTAALSPLGTAALTSGMFGESGRQADVQAARVNRISVRLAEAAERLRASLARSAHVDADGVVGEAYALAKLESCGENAAAVLFLAAAVLLEESRGGSCACFYPKERSDLPQGMAQAGASEAEVQRAAELLRLLADGEGARPADESACTLGIWSEAAEASCRRRPLTAEQLGTGEWILALERTRCLEAELAALIHRRLCTASGMEAQSGASRLEAAGSQELSGVSPLANRAQREAVARVLSALRTACGTGKGGLVVVTGGPGTGKTFTVAQMLRAVRGDPELKKALLDANAVRFTAPTGKAADRMLESIKAAFGKAAFGDPADRELLAWVQTDDIRPQTIHRLLGADPVRGTFRFHGRNPLPARLVIADEASMVGVALMARLAKAVRPDAVLVLLGDEHQLPSVEAGAVLRDLCRLDEGCGARCQAPLPGFRVHLTESNRQVGGEAGRRIIRAAQRINGGQVPLEDDMPLRKTAAELRFEGVERAVPESLSEICGIWECRIVSSGEDGEKVSGPGYAALVSKTYVLGADGTFGGAQPHEMESLFSLVQSRVILCAARAQAARLNADLHSRQVRFLGGLPGAGELLSGRFVPGEPVMMTRNDAARGIFNGDQGIVLRVRRQGERRHRFHAVFRKADGFRAFLVSELWDDLVHAFAMTVHKSQGSEYRDVLLVLPQSADSPLLTREILYTAVTRAKASVVVCGSLECLAAGAGRVTARRSALAERCWALSHPGGHELGLPIDP